MLLSAASQANIVANGGFETGDFTGWTQFGDTSFSGVDTLAPASGTYAAYFGSTTSTGGIFQTLATDPGKTYVVTFWLQAEADPAGLSVPNSFEFDWGGAARLTLTDVAAFPYKSYSFLLLATSATTDLRFTFTHIPAFWDLDSVSAAIPEPGSMALVVLAAALAAAFSRRRRRA